MSETTEAIDSPPVTASTTRRRGSGLSGMVLPELQQLAGSLGITGTARMRKSDLVAAIQDRQGSNRADTGSAPRAAAPATNGAVVRPAAASVTSPDTRAAGATTTDQTSRSNGAPANRSERSRADRNGSTDAPTTAPFDDTRQNDQRSNEQRQNDQRSNDQRSNDQRQDTSTTRQTDPRTSQNEQRQGSKDSRQNEQRQSSKDSRQNDQRSNEQRQNDQGQSSNESRSNDPGRDDDDRSSRSRRRRSRSRDRDRSRGSTSSSGRPSYENEQQPLAADDILAPVAGILDVLDNYAFVRTSGYLPGPNDVYVSLSMVRRYGLRKGDAVTGSIRQQKEGERKEKFNALVNLESVNGDDPERSKDRPEFSKLTPLYPQERLRLETEPHLLTPRVIDIVAPIGKGQRGLIVSPPKAGKTMVLQAIANAITTNNPEVHLMVVLVDERPEEVTDMQRSVKGEVIASTFDRPPSDHTAVSELAIERAKRLVEMGHDVVVLLDSITRLGRAYNLAAPASGRILSGGVDSTALYPPKRFLGAARNIEDGGSLTIFATALVETGSMMDTVIFEEFKGTGNAELKLDRKISDKRIFPAIDVNPSSTRKEELLLAPDELAINVKLRQVLSGLDSQQAINLLLDRLRKTRTNIEFQMQVSKSTPGNGDD